MVQTWIYKPLASPGGSIRLFDLQTAQEYYAPLVGSVREHYIIDLEVTYFALSYVWSDESLQVSVMDAHDSSKQIVNTRNLETAHDIYGTYSSLLSEI